MDRSRARRTNPPTPRAAFTLVELLAVVSIISLLTSMAVTGLARARSAARAVVCQTSLRSLAQATNLYYNERNDLPTTTQSILNVPGNQTAIVDLLAPYHGAAPPSTSECVKPWACPNDPWRWKLTGGTYLYYPAGIYVTWGLQPPHHTLRSLINRNPRMLLFLDGIPVHGDSYNQVNFEGSVQPASGPISFAI